MLKTPRPGPAARVTATLGLVALAILAAAASPPAPPSVAPAHAPAASPTAAPSEGPAQAASSDADDAARMFVQKCAGCHTVGRGKLTGPDLNDASTWAEADLARAIETMQKRVGPLSPAEIAALVALLKDAHVKDRLAREEGRAARAAAASLEPPSAQAGEAIFLGRAPLANGGVACASCHAAGGRGGTLGPDLTGVYAKLGETPLVSACEKTNFKIMSAAYRTHPVTKQEALHLTKYLAAVSAGPRAAPEPPVALTGAMAALVVFGALAFAYRGRAAGQRKTLTRRRTDVVD